jgi:small subunit ribosomal protein S21
MSVPPTQWEHAAGLSGSQKIGVDGGGCGWLVAPFLHRQSVYFPMSIEIEMRKNEPIDRALRRMKKKLERENIIKDVRTKRYAEKPSERRRRKEKVMAFTCMLRRRYAE